MPDPLSGDSQAWPVASAEFHCNTFRHFQVVSSRKLSSNRVLSSLSSGSISPNLLESKFNSTDVNIMRKGLQRASEMSAACRYCRRYFYFVISENRCNEVCMPAVLLQPSANFTCVSETFFTSVSHYLPTECFGAQEVDIYIF